MEVCTTISLSYLELTERIRHIYPGVAFAERIYGLSDGYEEWDEESDRETMLKVSADTESGYRLFQDHPYALLLHITEPPSEEPAYGVLLCKADMIQLLGKMFPKLGVFTVECDKEVVKLIANVKEGMSS